MKELLSQIPLAPSGGFRGPGPLGLEGQDSALAGSVFNVFISRAIGLLTVVAAIWFVFQFITGAIGIIASGGDKAKLESAKTKITTGLIGFVITIAAIFIIDLVGSLIGLDILDPTLILRE